jgi:tRNA threonylcarbamoyladenosine biosynthesis protein TsaE
MTALWPLPDLAATDRLGSALARSCPWDERQARVLYLSGELGAGKTTLAAALLRELGVDEPVRSPSYMLVELYEVHGLCALHVDLYRLTDPDELEQLGLRDYLNARTLLLIEWPEKGGKAVPPADLHIHLATQPARVANLLAASASGEAWLTAARGQQR